MAHEALIRGWQRLRGWVDHDREFLRTRERIAAQARLWQREGRLPERLLSPGRPLAEGEDILATRRADLEPLLIDYIQASAAAALAREEATRAVQRRRVRIARLIAVAMTLLALVAIGSGGIAWWQRDEAQRNAVEVQRNAAIAERNAEQAQRNQSRALAALAEVEAETGAPATAMRLALAAVSQDFATLDRAHGGQTEWSVLNVLEQLREMRRLRGHKDELSSVAFSPDGRVLATGSYDQTVRLWEVATGKKIATLSGHKNRVNSVAFSPDGRILATGSDDRTARLWEVATGNQIATFRGHKGDVESVAFSPDGRILATGSGKGKGNGKAQLWDLSNNRVAAVLRHQDVVEVVAFSPNGRILATGSGDGKARLWDLATGKKVMTSNDHYGEEVVSVAFSPDGQTLATASGFETVRLWDVSTQKEITAFHSRDRRVSAVAFSPDGRFLATGSFNGTVRLWPVGQRLIDLACARVHDLPLFENDKKRFGIDNEWCTPEVSGALRAKLGLTGIGP